MSGFRVVYGVFAKLIDCWLRRRVQQTEYYWFSHPALGQETESVFYKLSNYSFGLAGCIVPAVWRACLCVNPFLFKTSAAKQHQHRAEDLTFVRQLAIFEAMLVIFAPPRLALQESGGSSHNVNMSGMLLVNISHSHSDSGVMTGHILWIPSAGRTDEYTWYQRGLCPSFFLIWQCQLACLCPVVIYNQSPIHPWMCSPAAASLPLIRAPLQCECKCRPGPWS